ncbi:ferredoxin III, nif-specific [Heliobacterium gestii]|uniref:Ferredoxin III, nif-specific n=1 Tax=Heliomicrobium gestii TaxID=2699 RepID=A0A845LGN7_HELGE|nr:ferredoxin III, nif-specific [Heliomicrobium gestii]MBM7868427.1 Nif-specific ferredoxin III [Heliomicrobium gestii]MZP44584.1 ferredoxin III, nif-specific [Heliomicrobium gestii]
MAYFTGVTYGGQEWTPKFVETIDPMKCMGCGRCIKVCSQGALGLDTYMDEDDMQRMISVIADKDRCIGCQACGKSCAKRCLTFAPKEI